MNRILVAGAALLAFAGTALAQGPAAAPVFTWNGPYVGAFGGYGFGYAGATNDADAGAGNGFDDGLLDLTLGLAPRGAFGGVTLGFNSQSGAFVVGGEINGGYLALADAFSLFVADGPNGILDDDEGAVSYGWYATFAARVGLAFNRTLLFATAGGIITEYAGAYGDLNDGVTDPTDATTLFGPQYGYIVGAGAEFAFDSGWTARLEYSFFDLGTDTTTNLDDDVFIHRNNAHLVRFGLNFLFTP